ncbi:glycosyltransferase [Paractinoplanes rhizophilus]|uniref:Glycosyltransferase n=1 Tax=Paractinoplanes rhizophilus TaxID=1416877 RepID=A0ABW2HNT7_9ACTN
MNATPFRFSIIVPTYNRRDILRDTVASIAATVRPWPCELIVVVDGSTDGTAEALGELVLPLPIKVLDQPNRGAAAARNAGAAVARGRFLLFLDDDMTVEPDLIIEHDKTLLAGADAVVGHMQIDDRSPVNILTRGVERWATERRVRLDLSGGRLGVADFLTGQLSVRAEWFTKVGGFDRALTAHGTFGGEDTDLVYRLLQEGARARFAPNAVSHQRYVVSAEQNIRQWRQAGESDAILSRKHPGLGAVLSAGHRGDTLDGRLAKAIATLPQAPVRALSSRVVERVDRGRMDLATEFFFAKVRDIAYWTGARANGGLVRTAATGVGILAYHAIEEIDDPRVGRYSVAPARFAAQISALVQAGYTFIDGDDLLEHLAGRPLKPRSVLLTFDDAYESMLTHAAPVLERHGIPAVVCVVSDEIGGYNAWDVAHGAGKLPLLTAEQLGEIHGRGWELASHSRRHAHLTTLGDAVLRADLAGSRTAVTALGHGEARFLAYPYGEHDRRVRDRARRAGYAAAFALTTARAHPAPGNRYALPRVEVCRETTPVELLHQLADPARLDPRDVLRRELGGLASGVLALMRRAGSHPAEPATPAIWCCDFDLAGDATSAMVPPRDETTMRVLVRLHGEPLGYVTRPRTGTPRDHDEIRAAAWRELGDPLVAHLIEEGAEIPEEAERDGWRPAGPTRNCPNHVVSDALVSVVVCTRNRSESLPACLDRLAAVAYRPVEFLVVDNAPADDATRAVVERYAAGDDRFRYVREPRPGLSRARNAGLAAARGRYLAYTDDDVAVDRGWIHGLIRGFQRRDDVACVTGLVCTAAIGNGSEAYFDARLASWSTRCRPQFFDLSMGDRYGVLYPFSAGIFGTGASFAFQRERLVRAGGFDEALGAGTLTRGGEDLDIFVRILLDGGAIAYEPSAVVWHHHRADEASLLEQMYGYGTGLTAYLTKLLLDPSTRNRLLRRVPAGLIRIAQIRSRTNERLGATVAAPAGAMRRELTGFLAGPLLYLRARRARERSR